MSTETLDPLAMTGDAPDVVAFPNLSEGIKSMNLKSVDQVKFEGKDGKPDSEATQLTWALIANDTDTEGRTAYAGRTVNQLLFKPTDRGNKAEYDAAVKSFKEEIGMVVKAVVGRAEAKNKTLADCIGKVAKVKIGLFVSKKNGKEYNTVKVIVPKE